MPRRVVDENPTHRQHCSNLLQERDDSELDAFCTMPALLFDAQCRSNINPQHQLQLSETLPRKLILRLEVQKLPD